MLAFDPARVVDAACPVKALDVLVASFGHTAATPCPSRNACITPCEFTVEPPQASQTWVAMDSREATHAWEHAVPWRKSEGLQESIGVV